MFSKAAFNEEKNHTFHRQSKFKFRKEISKVLHLEH